MCSPLQACTAVLFCINVIGQLILFYIKLQVTVCKHMCMRAASGQLVNATLQIPQGVFWSLLAMYLWPHIPERWEAAGQSEHKGFSNVFRNNLPCWYVGKLGLLQMSSLEKFYGFIMYFFYLWILVTVFCKCLGDDGMAFFSCDTPAVFCGLKNFTRPSIDMREGR